MVRHRIANPRYESSQFESDAHFHIHMSYIMRDTLYELALKAATGYQLPASDKQTVQEYKIRYELVRLMCLEKMRQEGLELKNLHSTPGESFMEAPLVDTTNNLLKVLEAVKNNDYEAVDEWDD